MNDKAFTNKVTSAIYEILFDMTLPEMIATAKIKAGDHWNYMGWDDDNDDLRQCLSKTALEAIMMVEYKITYRLMNAGQITLDDILNITRREAQNHPRVTNIWGTTGTNCI